jgi:hypothetical protein
MSWVTIIWAMIASACLTLALVHLLVWWRRREVLANLLFALTAVAAAVFAGCELWMMRAETPGAFLREWPRPKAISSVGPDDCVIRGTASRLPRSFGCSFQ